MIGKQIAQAADLTLKVIIDKRGLYVLGDEHRLRWAIGNLIDNAIKYTPPGGQLTLEIRGQAQGMAYLRIRDNGVGIAADELPQMFTRFYRGNPMTKTGETIRVPGMGQGLNMARQIVETHGGQLQIKSKQFCGTAANFTLPLTAPVGMALPQLDEVDMEGETVKLSVDVDEFWEGYKR